MRPRALAFLLVLTVADYLLWNWSIAGGHDVVSLVAGLTLLPLGTVSIAQLALGAARVMGLLLGRPSHSVRAKRTAQAVAATEHARQTSAVESDPPSSRLAA